MIAGRIAVAATVCLVAGPIASLLAGAVAAKDDARQEQLRQMSQDRGDPRCAADGAGFVWVESARSCVRIGGLVGVQGTTGTAR